MDINQAVTHVLKSLEQLAIEWNESEPFISPDNPRIIYWHDPFEWSVSLANGYNLAVRSFPELYNSPMGGCEQDLIKAIEKIGSNGYDYDCYTGNSIIIFEK